MVTANGHAPSRSTRSRTMGRRPLAVLIALLLLSAAGIAMSVVLLKAAVSGSQLVYDISLGIGLAAAVSGILAFYLDRHERRQDEIRQESLRRLDRELKEAEDRRLELEKRAEDRRRELEKQQATFIEQLTALGVEMNHALTESGLERVELGVMALTMEVDETRKDLRKVMAEVVPGYVPPPPDPD